MEDIYVRKGRSSVVLQRGLIKGLQIIEFSKVRCQINANTLVLVRIAAGEHCETGRLEGRRIIMYIQSVYKTICTHPLPCRNQFNTLCW